MASRITTTLWDTPLVTNSFNPYLRDYWDASANPTPTGRQGGDEFVVLLPEVTHAADAAVSAAKIITELKNVHTVDEHRLHVTVSIGTSTYPDHGENGETLIKNADTAMYHAKQCGRDNFQFFKPDLSLQAVKRQSLEGQLRYALERHELLLHYQPKVNLQDREPSRVSKRSCAGNIQSEDFFFRANS